MERIDEINNTLETIREAWLQAPELRLMQLLVNAWVFGKMEFIDSVPFVRDPFHINDERICNMVDWRTCWQWLECPKSTADERQEAQTALALAWQIDWEEVKKAPLYVPAKRVPIDSAKFIVYKWDRDFNGLILPVFFYIHVPYCANEEKAFWIDFVPHEYIPKEWNLAGNTCYDDWIYAVDLEYASRSMINQD